LKREKYDAKNITLSETLKLAKTYANKKEFENAQELYVSGNLEETLSETIRLSQSYPNIPLLPNLQGGGFFSGMGQFNQAITCYVMSGST